MSVCGSERIVGYFQRIHLTTECFEFHRQFVKERGQKVDITKIAKITSLNCGTGYCKISETIRQNHQETPQKRNERKKDSKKAQAEASCRKFVSPMSGGQVWRAVTVLVEAEASSTHPPQQLTSARMVEGVWTGFEDDKFVGPFRVQNGVNMNSENYISFFYWPLCHMVHMVPPNDSWWVWQFWWTVFHIVLTPYVLTMQVRVSCFANLGYIVV